MIIKKIAILITVVLLASCSSKRPIVRTKSSPTPMPVLSAADNKRKDMKLEATSVVRTYDAEIKLYVENFQEIAKNNMKTHGIPASITLAQGILESGVGKGTLAKTANNHFGIKCHTGWTGESVRHDDDALQECFRKYAHPAESYNDHSLFLTSRNRYSSLFKLDGGDYKSWANGLKTAGYATDVKYPEKLISIIERFELYKFDNEVLRRNNAPINNIPLVEIPDSTYTIQKGDTLYSLSKKFKISVDELKKLNSFSESGIRVGQKIKIK